MVSKSLEGTLPSGRVAIRLGVTFLRSEPPHCIFCQGSLSIDSMGHNLYVLFILDPIAMHIFALMF
jgi:hypothetical protein